MKRWVLAALVVLVVGQAAVIAALMNWRSSPTVVIAPTPTPAVAAPPPSPVVTPPPAPAVPAQGRVEFTSEPAGARVTVDGVDRGVTPLVLSLDPGAHAVVMTDGRTTTTKTLEVTAGGTVTMAAAMAPAGPAAGWVTIAAPMELQVFQGGTLIGTTASQKLLLPAGKHELDVVNEALEFRASLTVDVLPGRTAKAAVSLPNGSISINALPWAIVWLNGKEVGTTPVATMTVPIGQHEVIWRHPQFGERKQTVTVTTKMPVRLVMDFNR